MGHGFGGGVAAGLLACAAGAAEWRFEGADLPGRAAGPASRAPGPPAPFVYDPLAGRAAPNAGALRLAPTDDVPARVELPWPSEAAGPDGFTIEVFARADAALPNRPDRTVPVVRKTRRGPAAAEAGLEIHTTPKPHSYKWWVGTLTPPGAPPVRLEHNRYQGLAHVREPVWRHLALVYDARARTLAAYADYTLLDRLALAAPLALDDGPLAVGGVADAAGFAGEVDELRVSPRPLAPHEFLRATAVAWTNVSLAPRPGPLPPDSGFVDLRLRYGAVGDGRTDDTGAFRRAFAELANRVPIEFHTLYIPEGTYLLSGPVSWTRFLVVQGAGRDRTVLRLRDGAPGFGDPTRPECLLYAGWDEWRNRTGKGNAGNVIANYLFDLAVDTGRGNPGAVALSFHANNVGAVERVTLRSGDGDGAVGLDFTTAWPGPCLVKHVSIEGFRTGVRTGWQEYSLVFEDLSLRGFREVGIDNRSNLLSLRRLASEGEAPVVRNNRAGMVTLLDSTLRGAGPAAAGTAAVLNPDRGGLFLRNVAAPGYAAVVRDAHPAAPGGTNVGEFVSGEVRSCFETAPRSLGLPVEDAPEIALGDPAGWVSVERFAGRVAGGDWAPALQAAVDSGAETLYFPANRRYPCRAPVVLRGRVRQVFGMLSGPQPDKSLGDAPVLRVEGPPGTTLLVERLDTGRILHVSGQRLVLRHLRPDRYEAAPGAGDVFIEDCGGVFRFARGQRAWGRQLNPETKIEPEIVNDGADLWVLGLKTEYASVNLVNRNGARTEILGGLVYPVTKVPPEMPMLRNEDASLAAVFGVSAYQADHAIYVEDVRGGETRRLLRKDVDAAGARRFLHLYVSRPPAP